MSQAHRLTPNLPVLTLIRVAWTNLSRDRVAQALTFLLPIIFFSIFATVFGQQNNPQTTRIRVAVVDEDGSEFSRRMVEGLKKEGGLRVRTAAGEDAADPPLDRATAQRLVRNGDVPVAVILSCAWVPMGASTRNGYGRYANPFAWEMSCGSTTGERTRTIHCNWIPRQRSWKQP